METIRNITEGTFQHRGDKSYTSTMEGYIITTDKQEIKVGIDNGQSCCENWGYLITNDNPDEFIGALLLGVKVTDTCLTSEKLKDLDSFETSLMFIDFETSKGTLQFVAYNEHNGFYGHEAVCISTQLNHSDIL